MTKRKKTAKKTASKAAPRVGRTPIPKGTKKAPADDGLSRAEIDRANASGPGAVATLISAAAKKGKATPPAKGKAATTPAAPAASTTTATTPRERDPRLPKPGTVLTRTFGNKEIEVEVLDAGFRYDGKTWRSLSAIAREVSGTSWNGYLFFNLATRATKASAAPTETK